MLLIFTIKSNGSIRCTRWSCILCLLMMRSCISAITVIRSVVVGKSLRFEFPHTPSPCKSRARELSSTAEGYVLGCVEAVLGRQCSPGSARQAVHWLCSGCATDRPVWIAFTIQMALPTWAVRQQPITSLIDCLFRQTPLYCGRCCFVPKMSQFVRRTCIQSIRFRLVLRYLYLACHSSRRHSGCKWESIIRISWRYRCVAFCLLGQLGSVSRDHLN